MTFVCCHRASFLCLLARRELLQWSATVKGRGRAEWEDSGQGERQDLHRPACGCWEQRRDSAEVELYLRRIFSTHDIYRRQTSEVKAREEPRKGNRLWHTWYMHVCECHAPYNFVIIILYSCRESAQWRRLPNRGVPMESLQKRNKKEKVNKITSKYTIYIARLFITLYFCRWNNPTCCGTR